MKRMVSLKLITSCMKLILHAIIILRLGDNVRGKWREREGKRKKNESCYGCVEVNIKPACLSVCLIIPAALLLKCRTEKVQRQIPVELTSPEFFSLTAAKPYDP